MWYRAHPTRRVTYALAVAAALGTIPTPVVAQDHVLEPFVECISPIGQNFIAFYGYENAGTETIEIPIGPDNEFVPPPPWRFQPTSFPPGRFNSVASDVFAPDQTLTWRVAGNSATADANSLICGTAPDDADEDGLADLQDACPMSITPADQAKVDINGVLIEVNNDRTKTPVSNVELSGDRCFVQDIIDQALDIENCRRWKLVRSVAVAVRDLKRGGELTIRESARLLLATARHARCP